MQWNVRHGHGASRRARYAWWGSSVALLAFALAGCAPQTAAPKPTPTPIAPDARLAGRLVYVTVGLELGVSTPGLVEAVDAQTGALKWKSSVYTTAGQPVVSQGTLYVAADDGTVHALDAVTGVSRWTFKRTVGVSEARGLDGYVALAGDTLYVTSDSGAVYALDAATGAQRWVYTAPAGGDTIYTVPVVGFGMVYVSAGGFSGDMFALDAATGKLRWSASQSGGFNGQPLLVGDALYVGAANPDTMHVLDAHTGATRWTYDTASQIRALPAVGSDTVYVGAQDANIYAIRSADHTLAWKFETGGAAGSPLIPTGAAPLLDGATLYVSSVGGMVYALDARTGKQKWGVPFNSPVDGAPALLDGTLFITTENGQLVALRASDGVRIWSDKTGGYDFAAPLVTTPSGS